MILKQKKNDSDCNFYNFSLLVPNPNNLLVVCLCISIFHGIFTPAKKISLFFSVWLKQFFASCSQGLEKCEISWGPSVLGEAISFSGERGWIIFFHKAINDQSCKFVNARIVDDKIICLMCVCLLFSLLVENFPVKNFLSVQVLSQTFKRVFAIAW